MLGVGVSRQQVGGSPFSVFRIAFNYIQVNTVLFDIMAYNQDAGFPCSACVVMTKYRGRWLAFLSLFGQRLRIVMELSFPLGRLHLKTPLPLGYENLS